MKKQAIAIVGLGKMGTAFLQELLDHPNEAVEIVAVVELKNTGGLVLAQAHDIRRRSIDDLIDMREELDIIFELTGEELVRQELRDKLRTAGNRHTIVATENIARMVWALIGSGAELPMIHAHEGY